MKIKIILSSILLFIISLIYLKYENLEIFFVKEKYYNSLVRFGIIKKCHYGPKFLDMFNEEGLDYLKLDKQVTLSSSNKLLDKDIKDKFTIPFITHHVYFTPTTKQIKLPIFYIQKIKANVNRLNAESTQWQHFIWTNNPKAFDVLIGTKGIVIKDLSDFKAHDLYQYLSNSILLGEKAKVYLMEASDITRMLALKRYGGIYTDIDYEILNAKKLVSLITKYDLISGRELNNELSFYGNAFIASKPEHPVINKAIELMEIYDLHLEQATKIPNHIKYPCSLYQKLYFKSPPLYTIAFLKENNKYGNNDLLLSASMLFNVDFVRTKNGGCNYTNQNSFSDDIVKQFLLESRYFDIIGADMFCGTWTESKENKKLYYWNWPFSLFMKTNEH